MKPEIYEQLTEIAKEFVRQGKSKRRWRIAFFIIIFVYFAINVNFLIRDNSSLKDSFLKESDFVAEISLSGDIASNGTINAEESIDLIQSAFKAEKSKAIILKMNSPGGSPVQSSRIFKAINEFKEKYNKKLYVVIEDVCASGCYYIASSGDGIYANENSIIGSIGVIISSFGLTELMKKIGLERRLYTAGKYKGLLDPFSKEDESVVKHFNKHILEKAHKNFIDSVKSGRGDKLSKDPNLFSGLVWLGEDAKSLGLIDGIKDSSSVAKDIIGIENIVRLEKDKTLLEKIIDTSVGKIYLFIQEKLQTTLI